MTQRRPRALDELTVTLHTSHAPARADEDTEESGRPSRTGTQIENAVTRSWAKELEHIGDRARLRIRLSIADLQRHIAGGEASFILRQEQFTRHLGEGLGE
ncbi:hypothetical protein BANT10_00667 [Brevibacterium antiquum]|uniref:Uncharacterized protein n=2 Tax=Brevibacterium antiquum TaxID=234835 RepID=A0A2H1JBT7_9MICO|nr:hypothetical protein BANT10_00667 [Brevibacterium antiquum]SMX84883.1 hypothetical protein BANT918_01476 [Brevibacterium antiquum CNRZ 918]